MKKVAFAGSFDPLTNGHLWVIKESLNIADSVLVLVADNSSKSGMFNKHERLQIIQETLEEEGLRSRVEVEVVSSEFIATFALDRGCEYLIRGIRSSSEFDYESLLQKTNSELLGIKSIFVMPPRDLDSVSSSYVKGLIGPSGWRPLVNRVVPCATFKALIKSYLKKIILKYTIEEAPLLNIDKLVNLIIDSYKSRAYHNIYHIVQCLEEFDWIMGQEFDHKKQVAVMDVLFAILFHDIVYDPISNTNEIDSAAKFSHIAMHSDLNIPTSCMVETLILSTAEYMSAKFKINDINTAIIKCVDLAILGKSPSEYHEYLNAIREEYAHLSDSEYIKGRLNVLELLIKLDFYPINKFKIRYHDKAVSNILSEINLLKLIDK